MKIEPDFYEKHAQELEDQQGERFRDQGSPYNFWDNGYEQGQTFLIERNRRLSETYSDRTTR